MNLEKDITLYDWLMGASDGSGFLTKEQIVALFKDLDLPYTPNQVVLTEAQLSNLATSCYNMGKEFGRIEEIRSRSFSYQMKKAGEPFVLLVEELDRQLNKLYKWLGKIFKWEE